MTAPAKPHGWGWHKAPTKRCPLTGGHPDCPHAMPLPTKRLNPGKGLPRSSPPKARKPVRAKRARPRKEVVAKTNEAFREYVRREPCAIGSRLWHGCSGRIEATHVNSRGAGGADEANLVPLCVHAHRKQHDLGIKTFQERYGIDLKAAAASYWDAFQVSQGLRISGKDLTWTAGEFRESGSGVSRVPPTQKNQQQANQEQE